MNKYIKKIKKLGNKTFDIHLLMTRKFVYQISICVLVLIVLFLNLNSFRSIKNYRNYTDENNCYMSFCRSSAYTFSFEAKSNTLDNFRIYLNTEASRLTLSDKLSVKISDDEGKVILETKCYLYNSTRNYAEVDCKGLELEQNERYIVKFTFEECSKRTLVVFLAHPSGGFDSSRDYIMASENEDEMSFDLAIGFSKILNINYRYSHMNAGYLFSNLAVYFLAVIILFFPNLNEKRIFKEIYRGVFGTLLIYLIGQVLNVENDMPLNILFPMSLKHYFCLFTILAIIVIVYYTLYLICGFGSLSMCVASLPFLVLAYVNSVKLVMRGDTFMPWDLFSAGIAVKTGSTYYFHITKPFICGIILTIAFVILLLYTATPRKNYTKTGFAVLGTLVMLGLFLMYSAILNTGLLRKLNVYYEVYPPMQSYNENGTYLAFLFHLNNLNGKGASVDSPELAKDIIDSYSNEVARQRLDIDVFNNSLKSVNSEGDVLRPNVICIMSEAYTDLFSIRGFKTNEVVTPFADLLRNESINGNLAVSIFGGGTCNTEFEFLTGNSMSTLLPGSSVYSFYVNDVVTDSLPYIYRENGYRTVALHSFDGDWWDRRSKYPLLGFDEFYTRDDFDENAKYVRRYISDMSTFEKITDIYDESVNSGDPLFLFCVTMQNHADFSERYDNMSYDVKIKDLQHDNGDEFNYANNYLSLLKESDDALEYLINHFRDSDYPTIVCFFGDHLPTLDDGFYDTLLENDLGNISLNDSLDLYETTYFIWANYDLYDLENPDFNSSIISPNFLGQEILDYSGIISPYSRSVLRILHEDICAVSAVAVYDNNGVPYTDVGLIPEEINDMLNDYSAVQYARIYFNGE